MQRWIAASVIVSSIALGAVACSDRMDQHDDWSTPPDDPCSQAFTCGACTPIEGCGWCQYGDGTGACTSGPQNCSGESFDWNWNPPDCPNPEADSGAPADTAPIDTGTASVDTGPAAHDTGAAPEAADDATSDDTATDAATGPDTSTSCNAPSVAGCAQTTGGSLCPGLSTLGCTSGAPDAPLGCSAVTVSDPSETFYCCPCAH